MDTLIVYYSRTGTTKKAALDLRGRLNCRAEEIIDRKNRAGALGWIMAGRDGMKGALTEINEPESDPAAFGLVVLATPVWAGNMTPAIRAYIEKNKTNLPAVAFLTAQGSDKRQRVFDELAAATGKKPVAELLLTAREIKSGEFDRKLSDFAQKLR